LNHKYCASYCKEDQKKKISFETIDEKLNIVRKVIINFKVQQQ